MTVAFPTLAGPVTEPERILDQLIMAVFASDYSQSNAFRGQVSSFQHLVHISGQNWVNLKGSLNTMFTTILLRHFSIADVTVTVTPINGDPAKMAVSLSAQLTTNTGQRLDLASSIYTADGLVTEILIGDRSVWTR